MCQPPWPWVLGNLAQRFGGPARVLGIGRQGSSGPLTLAQLRAVMGDLLDEAFYADLETDMQRLATMSATG